jgi:sortase A
MRTAVAAILDEPSSRTRAGRRRWSATNVVVAGMIFAGLGVLTYPTAGNWFSDLAHASDVSGYVSRVHGAAPHELEAQLAGARAYNGHLPNGPLRDPYILNASGQSTNLRDGWADYRRQLALTPESPMARIRIPQIGVDLPIYHGTENAVLDKGIGHLYGSALPVGGAGSHAVLTGHSGLPNADLFTRLPELDMGDFFSIDVAGETLTYRVAHIETVEPDEGDALRQVAGRDYVTLLTCTPIGVNSHRLLVRGERVEREVEEDASQALPSEGTGPGFPWWALILAGGGAASCAVAWPRRPATDAPRGTPDPRGEAAPS